MNRTSLFRFSNEQRKGIFALLTLIIGTQCGYFFWVSGHRKGTSETQNKEWLVMQSIIDSLKEGKAKPEAVQYPYNPNFITDYKGFQLGMSVEELDRLFEFRKQDKYVNSAKEFQEVTKISDSLLNVMAPNFKFPDWVAGKRQNAYFPFSRQNKKEKIVVGDINRATQDDLIKIYGIGQALSERILKQKEVLGGFVSMEQMQDIWGLSPEVTANLNQYFAVISEPEVKKIDINNLSSKELAKFPYFNYALAKEIVIFRSMHHGIKDVEDLTKIKGFPVEKIKIIALYLEF